MISIDSDSVREEVPLEATTKCQLAIFVMFKFMLELSSIRFKTSVRLLTVRISHSSCNLSGSARYHSSSLWFVLLLLPSHSLVLHWWQPDNSWLLRLRQTCCQWRWCFRLTSWCWGLKWRTHLLERRLLQNSFSFSFSHNFLVWVLPQTAIISWRLSYCPWEPRRKLQRTDNEFS